MITRKTSFCYYWNSKMWIQRVCLRNSQDDNENRGEIKEISELYIFGKTLQSFLILIILSKIKYKIKYYFFSKYCNLSIIRRMSINTLHYILQICVELIPIRTLYVTYYSLLQLILIWYYIKNWNKITHIIIFYRIRLKVQHFSVLMLLKKNSYWIIQ